MSEAASKRRALSDSEARWEAVVLISQAVQTAIDTGTITMYGEQRGWSDADIIAVEKHATARAEALLRRPRRSPGSGSSSEASQ